MTDARSTYEPLTDSAYINLAPSIGPGESYSQLDIERPQGSIILDFDREGRVLGVEVLGATALLTPATIAAAEVLDDQPLTMAQMRDLGL